MSKGRRRRAVEQPHDAIVKFTFSQIEHATGLLKSALPPAVVAATDWSTLRVEKDSFIEPSLRSTFSDLVFSARMKGQGQLYFYTLLEHQTPGEPLMVFRLSQYMGSLWARLVRDDPGRKTLPPIVPLLLCGSRAEWTAPIAFQDIIEGAGPARAALEPHIPHFELSVVDLSDGRARLMAREYLTAFARVVIWALTTAHDDERLLAEIDGMIDAIFEAYEAPNGREALAALLRYISATHERMSTNEVNEVLMEAAERKNKKDDFRDVTELWEHQGKLKGIEEGKLEGIREGKLVGKRAFFLDMLRGRFGALPASAQRRVKSASEEDLSAWALRVLTAKSVAEVLDAEPLPAPAKAPKPRTPAKKRAAPRSRAAR